LISGPLPVLKTVKASNLRVVVDLTGLTPGEYQLPPLVDLLPDSVKVASILPSNISVVIVAVENGEGTSTPIPTVSPSPNFGLPVTPTPALLPTATPLP
jgi:YbbR domain-containing protein